MAAFQAGLKGLILPKQNLSELQGDWPDGSAPSEQLKGEWEEARLKLVFKGVGTVEELLAFLFPSLAQRLARPAVTTMSTTSTIFDGVGGAAAEDAVGPVVSMGVPLYGQSDSIGADGMLARVKACLVSGAGEPVRDRG